MIDIIFAKLNIVKHFILHLYYEVLKLFGVVPVEIIDGKRFYSEETCNEYKLHKLNINWIMNVN